VTTKSGLGGGIKRREIEITELQDRNYWVYRSPEILREKKEGQEPSNRKTSVSIRARGRKKTWLKTQISMVGQKKGGRG